LAAGVPVPGVDPCAGAGVPVLGAGVLVAFAVSAIQCAPSPQPRSL